MPLVIVESAAKGKKIQSYLGAGYDVAASYGHVSDLPPKDIGVYAPDFRPKYEVTDKGKSTIANLKKLAAKHGNDVYLATDLDREGEAIAWHLANILKLKNIKRVVFPEITKTAVMAGIASPRPINMDTVKGQESRRVLDRFVGYLPSLSIYSRFGAGNSAGRVQSIGLRLVYERDLAIESFKSIEHYNVFAHFELDGISFKSEWQHPFKRNAKDNEPETDHGEDGTAKYLTNKLAAEKMAAAVVAEPNFTLKSYETKETSESAPCPFTTILLQQAASKRFGWTAKKTMEIAQSLYEKGLITYHRTDSKDLSEEAIKQIRDFIQAFQAAKNINNLLPEKPNKFAGAANAQEAHEAIRPSNINFDGAGLDEQESQLYGLIRTRTITSQMADARHLVTKVQLTHNATQQPFSLSGKKTIFTGWRLFASFIAEDEDEKLPKLPDLSSVSELVASTADVATSVTKPPAKMTERELIRILDRKGIGRPSTMATICETNLKRQYIIPDGKALTTTPKGREICAWLIQHFQFMTYEYSSEMEKGIDDVMSQNLTYVEFIKSVYDKVSSEVSAVNKSDNKINADDNGNIIRRKFETKPCPCCKAETFTRYPTKKDPKRFVWGCSDRSCKQPLMGDINGEPVEFAARAS